MNRGLAEVKTSIETNNIVRATEIIKGFRNRIIHRAVEEEARLMRVILHKGKDYFRIVICFRCCLVDSIKNSVTVLYSRSLCTAISSILSASPLGSLIIAGSQSHILVSIL